MENRLGGIVVMEWENPFDGQEEFELFVPYVRGTYAYPYASRITGQDYRFGFVRKFLPRVRGELCDYGRVLESGEMGHSESGENGQF